MKICKFIYEIMKNLLYLTEILLCDCWLKKVFPVLLLLKVIFFKYLKLVILWHFRYLIQYQEAIPCEQVVSTLCDIKQAYTQFGGKSYYIILICLGVFFAVES